MDREFLIKIMALALISALGLGSTAFAQQEGDEAIAAIGEGADEAIGEGALEKFKIRKPTYTYQSLGRRDPFRSLIETVEETATGESAINRPPIERYNVSQLKLIAVVSAGSDAYALVVLPDGKSYTLREGMNVGLHGGIVKEIRSDQVVVDVEFKDHKGKIKTEEVFLKLRQEGDK